jgi:hypothetical protein
VRDPDGATHLDAAARRMLRLDDAQRVAGIDRDLWIGYGRAHDAHERLERILRSERRMRPDNLLIVGASNNGKTAIARRFLSRHTVPEDPKAECASLPVALVQAPTARESRCSWRRSCKHWDANQVGAARPPSCAVRPIARCTTSACACC